MAKIFFVVMAGDEMRVNGITVTADTFSEGRWRAEAEALKLVGADLELEGHLVETLEWEVVEGTLLDEPNLYPQREDMEADIPF